MPARKGATQLNVSVRKELRAPLRLAAKAEQVTQSALVERAIRAYLARSAVEDIQLHRDQVEVLTALQHLTTVLQDIERRLTALESPRTPPPTSTGFFRRHRPHNGTLTP